jgi:hypothetical protein
MLVRTSPPQEAEHWCWGLLAPPAHQQQGRRPDEEEGAHPPLMLPPPPLTIVPCPPGPAAGQQGQLLHVAEVSYLSWCWGLSHWVLLTHFSPPLLLSLCLQTPSCCESPRSSGVAPLLLCPLTPAPCSGPDVPLLLHDRWATCQAAE